VVSITLFVMHEAGTSGRRTPVICLVFLKETSNVVVNTPALYSGGPGYKSLNRDRLS
jgi:hypothetical protein